MQYEERFGATAPTVQKAFDRLLEDRFVEVRHRVGTFVAPQPPHLFRYALTLPTGPDDPESQSRFIRALKVESQRIKERTGKEIVFFYEGMSGPPREAFHRLAADVKAERLAGIIHARNFWWVSDPRLQSPNIPSVGVVDPVEHPNCGVMVMDYSTVLDRGAAHLAAQGCRRVAVMEDAEGLGHSELIPERLAILKRHGLQLADNGYASLPSSVPSTARYWVRLLISQSPERRPDGLLVMDDNMTGNVVRGLLEAGAGGLQNFHVVSHNNFPVPLPEELPLYVLGYHAADVLEAAIQYIDRRKAGEHPPNVMHFQAKTEAEVYAQRAAAGEPRGRTVMAASGA